MSPRIMDSFNNVELIEISKDDYCVRKTVKTWTGKTKYFFFVLTTRGVDFTSDDIIKGRTTGALEDALKVFNAHKIMTGIKLS